MKARQREDGTINNLKLAVLLAFLLLLVGMIGDCSRAFANPVTVNIQWDPDIREIQGGEPIETWLAQPLGIANEMTLERDWLGEIFFVAVYDRMLKGYEIKENFEKGVSGEERTGALALYNFEEGTGTVVEDKTDNPLNLNISASSNTTWVPGGLLINGTSLLSSSGPAQKIADGVNASKAFTVEAWIKPSNLTQGGPARIVTMSIDSVSRNFTLGQSAENYVMRVLRQGSPANGTPAIEAVGVVKPELTHLAFAMDERGAATLYVDGVGVSSLHTWKVGTEEDPVHRPWERINFYERGEGEDYDFDNPFLVFDQEYGPNGYSKPIRVSHPIEYENFVVSKKYFVLRSGAGAGDEAIESEDSEEASLETDMTRPPRTVLSVVKESGVYNFSWTDTGERTYRYQLQYSFRDPTVNRGGYVVLRTIDAPGLTTGVQESEIQELLGDNPSMWLTMVSITKPLIYSRWTEVDVQIQAAMPAEVKPVVGLSVRAEE